MKAFKHLHPILFCICIALGSINSLQAQTLDDDAIALSEQEIARLRAILDQPIDPNALKATRVEAYKQKQGAAGKRGDAVKQEERGREGAQRDREREPRWGR